ncbi:hypothetical protein F5Y08DRAFT_317320 [Xylaria arbuscula]|nr:hypothetical protein F5Y08DRAFT_317320 [Xylaria arbuscula]
MSSTLLDLYNRAQSPSVGSSSTINVPLLQTPDHPTVIEKPPVSSSEIPTAGTKLELIDLTEKYRTAAQVPTITPTGYSHRPKLVSGQFSEYALRVVRVIRPDGSDGGTRLEISSPVIQDVLRRIMSSYAFLNLATDPIVIKKPFAPLFHYREELREIASDSQNDVERAHMKLLMEDFYKPYLGEVESIYRDEVPKGRVRFELLWTLFRAEDDVIVHTNYYREMHRVVHYDEYIAGDDCFLLFTWRWGYNAGKFGPCSETIRIPHFSSTRRIQQLPCFPIKQLQTAEAEKICRSLVDRGIKWRDFIHPSHKMYSGPMWIVPNGARNLAEQDIRHTNSQVMLDHDLHAENYGHLNDQLIGAHGYQLNLLGVSGGYQTDLPAVVRISSDGVTPRFNYTSRAGPNKNVIFNQAECYKDDENYHMTEEEALLCPAKTRGFSLLDKTWGFFMVEHISDMSFSLRAFDSLALDAYYKDIIQAIVRTNDSETIEFDDTILGKGRGVIISLEGPPGSGKTLTAESMAEVTQRPLYAISTSELGIVAREAEKSLVEIFRRTVRWQAVVLLDEADLFLTARTTGELERNALVTVFLRTLEYFGGVMFLTSNRIENFDRAFESRIHLRVPFQSPGADIRSRIWKTFLPERWDANGTAERLGRDLSINGREIRNLIRISLLVAKHRNKELSEELIREIHSRTKSKPLTSVVDTTGK